MNKAARIIKQLGGPAAVSRALGLAQTTVWRWTKERELKWGGGIPWKHHPAVKRMAARQGVEITLP